MSRPSRLGLAALAAVVLISLVISQQATAQEDDTLHGRRLNAKTPKPPKPPKSPKFSKAVSEPPKKPPPLRRSPPPLRSPPPPPPRQSPPPPPPQRPPPIPSIPSRCPDAPDIVSRHNAYRALHQAQPLVWDDALAARAQAWAARNAAAGCSQEHDWSVYTGENILVKTEYPKPDSICAVAVDGWYSEVDGFNFNTDKLLTTNRWTGAFHFTQLIWNGSTTIGCGVANADVEIDFGRFTRIGGCKVIVCRYMAPGNVATDEEFRRNVFDIARPPPPPSRSPPRLSPPPPPLRSPPPPRRGLW